MTQPLPPGNGESSDALPPFPPSDLPDGAGETAQTLRPTDPTHQDAGPLAPPPPAPAPPRRSGLRDVALLLGLAFASAILLATGFVASQAIGLSFHLSLALGTVLAFLPLASVLRAFSRVTLSPGRVTAPGLLIAAVFGVLLAGLSNVIMVALTEISPYLAEMAEQREDLILDILRPGDPGFLLTVIIVVAILPGIFEELYFRGALREFFHRRSPNWRIWAIGFVFALIHADAVGFLPLVLVGAALGWMAERTGGWLLCAVAHAAHNGVAIALVNLGYARPSEAEAEAAATDPSIAALLGIAGLAALLLWASARLVPPSITPHDSGHAPAGPDLPA